MHCACLVQLLRELTLVDRQLEDKYWLSQKAGGLLALSNNYYCMHSCKLYAREFVDVYLFYFLSSELYFLCVVLRFYTGLNIKFSRNIRDV